MVSVFLYNMRLTLIVRRVFLTLGFIFVIIVAVRAGQRGEGYRGPPISKG